MPVVRSGDLEASRAFYVGFLGFDVGMDEEGFLMLRSSSTPTTQLIVATGDAADQEVLHSALRGAVGFQGGTRNDGEGSHYPEVSQVTIGGPTGWGLRRRQRRMSILLRDGNRKCWR